MVSLGRFVQKLPFHYFRPMERALISRDLDTGDHKQKIIFLLAAPRSGSTLTYQCFSHGTNVASLKNITNLFYQLPYFGLIVSEILGRPLVPKFNSNEGYVSGLLGESEGHKFWHKWTASPLSEENITTVSTEDIQYFKMVTTLFTKKYSKYLFAGYLGHVLHWKLLNRHFPNAAFIVLLRDPVATIASLYKIRTQNSGKWISTHPLECTIKDGSHLLEEVVQQVYWINRRLMESAKLENAIVVHYEDLCENPRKEITRVIDSLKILGFSDIKYFENLPSTFKQSKKVDKNLRNEILRILQILQEKNGFLHIRS